jgi:hypothetical protein
MLSLHLRIFLLRSNWRPRVRSLSTTVPAYAGHNKVQYSLVYAELQLSFFLPTCALARILLPVVKNPTEERY